MAVLADELSAIFERVITEHGTVLGKESDLVTWFCHYLILRGGVRFTSEWSKARYDLMIESPGEPLCICEFKYAWDGWPTAEIEKDKGKLLRVVNAGRDTAFFLLAYKREFQEKAEQLRRSFHGAGIRIEAACIGDERSRGGGVANQ